MKKFRQVRQEKFYSRFSLRKNNSQIRLVPVSNLFGFLHEVVFDKDSLDI